MLGREEPAWPSCIWAWPLVGTWLIPAGRLILILSGDENVCQLIGNLLELGLVEPGLVAPSILT